MKKAIAAIVESHRPGCELTKECLTKCGECAADDILDLVCGVLETGLPPGINRTAVRLVRKALPDDS